MEVTPLSMGDRVADVYMNLLVGANHDDEEAIIVNIVQRNMT